MNWFVTALKRYAQFSGRAARPEYWYFTLFWMLIYFGLVLVEGIAGLRVSEQDVGLLSGLFALVMLLPSISVGVRRLHDTGRVGWWILVAFIPLVGGIVLLVFMCQRGDPGPNAYGDGPGPML